MARVEYAAPGKAPLPHTGDIVLTHGHGPIKAAIRSCQRLRFRGPERYWFWNHVACVVGDKGELIEAKEGHGVRRANIRDYAAELYAIGHVGASDEDKREMVAYAESCLGQDYGYLTIISLLGFVITNGRLTVGMSGTEVCSQIAASFLERQGAIFPRGASSVMPAHLAQKYDVRPDAAPLS